MEAVNLYTADEKELKTLYNVGPAAAAKIIILREQEPLTFQLLAANSKIPVEQWQSWHQQGHISMVKPGAPEDKGTPEKKTDKQPENDGTRKIPDSWEEALQEAQADSSAAAKEHADDTISSLTDHSSSVQPKNHLLTDVSSQQGLPPFQQGQPPLNGIHQRQGQAPLDEAPSQDTQTPSAAHHQMPTWFADWRLDMMTMANRQERQLHEHNIRISNQEELLRHYNNEFDDWRRHRNEEWDNFQRQLDATLREGLRDRATRRRSYNSRSSGRYTPSGQLPTDSDSPATGSPSSAKDTIRRSYKRLINREMGSRIARKDDQGTSGTSTGQIPNLDGPDNTPFRPISTSETRDGIPKTTVTDQSCEVVVSTVPTATSRQPSQLVTENAAKDILRNNQPKPTKESSLPPETTTARRTPEDFWRITDHIPYNRVYRSSDGIGAPYDSMHSAPPQQRDKIGQTGIREEVGKHSQAAHGVPLTSSATRQENDRGQMGIREEVGKYSQSASWDPLTSDCLPKPTEYEEDAQMSPGEASLSWDEMPDLLSPHGTVLTALPVLRPGTTSMLRETQPMEKTEVTPTVKKQTPIRATTTRSKPWIWQEHYVEHPAESNMNEAGNALMQESRLPATTNQHVPKPGTRIVPPAGMSRKTTQLHHSSDRSQGRQTLTNATLRTARQLCSTAANRVRPGYQQPEYPPSGVRPPRRLVECSDDRREDTAARDFEGTENQIKYEQRPATTRHVPHQGYGNLSLPRPLTTRAQDQAYNGSPHLAGSDSRLYNDMVTPTGRPSGDRHQGYYQASNQQPCGSCAPQEQNQAPLVQPASFIQPAASTPSYIQPGAQQYHQQPLQQTYQQQPPQQPYQQQHQQPHQQPLQQPYQQQPLQQPYQSWYQQQHQQPVQQPHQQQHQQPCQQPLQQPQQQQYPLHNPLPYQHQDPSHRRGQHPQPTGMVPEAPLPNLPRTPFQQKDSGRMNYTASLPPVWPGPQMGVPEPDSSSSDSDDNLGAATVPVNYSIVSRPGHQQGRPEKLRLPAPKMPQFDGTMGDWDNFIFQFNNMCDYYQLGKKAKLQYLKGSLKDKAINFVRTLPPDSCRRYGTLIRRLQDRFAGLERADVLRRDLQDLRQRVDEATDEFADRVQTQVNLAYRGFPLDIVNTTATEIFMRGVRDRTAAYETAKIQPINIQQALWSVKNHVSLLKAIMGKSSLPSTRQVSFMEDPVFTRQASTISHRPVTPPQTPTRSMAIQTDRSPYQYKSPPRSPTRRNRPMHDRCVNYDEAGHFRAECPKQDTPKANGQQ